MKIYIASSWKNPYYKDLMDKLNKEFPNFEIYDFRDANSSFSFNDLPEWDETFSSYLECMKNEKFRKAFNNDYNALKTADLLILLLPCGKSSHLEAGYVRGMGKPVILYNPINSEYEFDLMHAMISIMVDNFTELIDWIRHENRWLIEN